MAALGERGAVRRVRADAMEKILSDVERFRRAHVRQQHDAAPGTRARRRQSVVRRAHDRDAAPACRRDGNLSYDGFIISVPPRCEGGSRGQDHDSSNGAAGAHDVCASGVRRGTAVHTVAST